MIEFNYIVKQKANRVVEQVADLSVLADTPEEADRLAAQKFFEARYSLDWFDSDAQ